MKNSNILALLEAGNEEIWFLIREIHEGRIVDISEVKEKLINITGRLNTEVLIPLQRKEEGWES